MNSDTKIRNFQESRRLELKEQLPENLEKEAVAFLNASGGKDIFYFSNSVSRISFFFEQGEEVEIPQKSREKSSGKNNAQNTENKNINHVAGSGKSRVESSVKVRDKILMVIRFNNDITIPELAYYLHLSTRAIDKNLKLLREEGKLRRVGANKSGHWEVID